VFVQNLVIAQLPVRRSFCGTLSFITRARARFITELLEIFDVLFSWACEAGCEVLFCELKDEAITMDCVHSGNSICLCLIRWAESPSRGTGSELCTALYVKLCITQSALLFLTWISFTSRPVRRISSWNTTCRQRNVGVRAQIIYPYSSSDRKRLACTLYFFHLEIQLDEPDFPHYNNRYFLDSFKVFYSWVGGIFIKAMWIWIKYTVRRSFMI